MRAIVLAGGLGTRLSSVVSAVPKSLAPIGGRPFLAWLFERLEREGVTEILLAVGYKGEKIVAAFGRRHGGVALSYELEDEPLGTGGALRRALGRIERFPVFVFNGDTFLEIDLRAMAAAHAAAAAPLSVAVRRMPDTGRYGQALIAEGRLVALEPGETGRAGMINCGAYLFAENLLAGPDLPPKFSFERDFLAHRAAALRPLAFEVEGRFLDIGVPDDYARAEREFAGAQSW